jgi:hypothetical protein
MPRPALLALPLVLLAGTAGAQVLSLTPADPQPEASDLQPGLAVAYAYPKDVRTIADAEDALGSARDGQPLKGLSYEDNAEGDLIMTARTAEKVAARITGYLRFDAAGTFEVEVFSNDGIALNLGGQDVAFHDEIHACESAGVAQVEVPEPGWYVVEATYFQRKGTACLAMDWNAEGEMAPVPDEAFAYTE